jgi:exodeoxyribonuclease VII large subunit
MRQQLSTYENQLRQHRPELLLAMLRERLGALHAQIGERLKRVLDSKRQILNQKKEMLRLLSPKNTLKRGYSLTTDAAGQIIRSIQNIEQGVEIVTEMSDGKIKSVVSQIATKPKRK